MRLKRRIMNIINNYDRHKIVGLIALCTFGIAMVLFHHKSKPEIDTTFMEIWNEYKETEAFNHIKKSLIKELEGEFSCPTVKCPVCSECEKCEICTTEPPPTCASIPECPKCPEVLESTELTMGELAHKYLVIDFEPFTQNVKTEKFDFVGAKTTDYKCESNPELNDYINKPQFSRDQFDYDVSRDGYTPKRLVCDECATHEVHVQSNYWFDNCDDVDPLSTVITVVATNLTEQAIKRIEQLELEIVSSTQKVKSPYALVLNGHFDFEPEDANLWRMVREAENQNADLVFGAWRNEVGQWSSPCLHYSLQNYTLHVWDGYYKSIGSMKYCDMGIGPVLGRGRKFMHL